MIPRSIDIGPLDLHLYGLIIALAIYVGWLLAKKRAHIYKIPKSIFDDPILLFPLVLSIIGARIYHVVDLWQIYINNPLSIFYIASGGLGIWGAITGMIVGIFIVSKIRKIEMLSALDLTAPSLLLAQSIGRVGNYINQEGFGKPTDLPWGVFIEKIYRPREFLNSTNFHPSFFYEAILNLVFFAVLLTLSRNLKFKGQTLALYLIFYASIRFSVEFFRIDTWTIGTVKIAHIISIGVLALGLYLFFSLKEKRK